MRKRAMAATAAALIALASCGTDDDDPHLAYRTGFKAGLDYSEQWPDPGSVPSREQMSEYCTSIKPKPDDTEAHGHVDMWMRGCLDGWSQSGADPKYWG
ncbi:hypothetical protein ACF1AO_01355 [Streptomyces longwoodensis]|uniref:hypothetical protein n=1 Tax=Streptomyces longwoodensis TaxID=68231 RepID=UPI00370368FE